jgi:hypothetical protein
MEFIKKPRTPVRGFLCSVSSIAGGVNWCPRDCAGLARVFVGFGVDRSVSAGCPTDDGQRLELVGGKVLAVWVGEGLRGPSLRSG